MTPERTVGGDGDVDTAETREWIDALDAVVQHEGADRARQLLTALRHQAARRGVEVPYGATTPYL
ncbi:MAG TPA: hypothetical protein VFA26_20615, partial [Gemmataceae bacterium]|nr:hypothetical protein [Gemmataceae bacterium]